MYVYMDFKAYIDSSLGWVTTSKTFLFRRASPDFGK